MRLTEGAIHRTPAEKRKQLAVLEARVAAMKPRESLELRQGLEHAITTLKREIGRGDA